MAEASSNVPLLEARELQVDAGQQRVLDVRTLDLHAGRVLTVMGPNGAGKSTLVRVLALLQSPSRGALRIFGSEVTRRTKHRDLRRRMSVVFQQPLLLSGSVQNNVAEGLKIRGLGRAESNRRVSEWLERLRVPHLADRPAHTLSMGEAQRVSLARAFAVSPEILLLDEPFAMLDVPTREELVREVAGLLREAAAATLFVTHDRDEAQAIGDELAVMMDGRIVQHDSVQSVFWRPISPDVAAFVGVDNVIPGRVEAVQDGLAAVRIGPATAQVVAQAAPGASVLLCVRPADVALTLPADVTRSSVRNAFRGRVTAVNPQGSQLRLDLDCGFNLIAYITRLSADELGLQPGTAVVASFKASSAHLIVRPDSRG